MPNLNDICKIILLLIILVCLSCNKNRTVSKLYTKVEVKENNIKLGEIPYSINKEIVFTLKNIGEETFIIYDIKPTCGCTKVKYDKTKINKNEEINVILIYDAMDSGFFYKTAIVESNSINPITLKFSGTIKK